MVLGPSVLYALESGTEENTAEGHRDEDVEVLFGTGMDRMREELC